ncbi:hypothetical protein GQ44DRAFT_726499 [Phaeosphaeriaceae sp. PMI808]|nr:hypothetical protein GQ44DRAFT_726499 [Phaeosphaeriaceae sp. PMI808]
MVSSDIHDNHEKIVDLAIIDYQQLLSGYQDKELTLYSTCTKWEFLYLSFENMEDLSYLSTVQKLFEVSENYFDKPLSEKVLDTLSDPALFNICEYDKLEHWNLQCC